MTDCHSCGMPLEPKTQSKFSERYCIYCQNQETGKLKSYEEVREGSIQAAIDFLGKNEREAIQLADQNLPKLPRWRKKFGK